MGNFKFYTFVSTGQRSTTYRGERYKNGTAAASHIGNLWFNSLPGFKEMFREVYTQRENKK
ncbi:Uncharacterized protein APZ42_004602 [Daphnia magna]|uniref:Uncharacterized protein n=1 Tax=Daphnia magna TaxID=35525 RepID=A0A0P5CSV6_9CRUS|nr:Uncharacterized protein APZ42_004602 [Daphnia magna]